MLAVCQPLGTQRQENFLPLLDLSISPKNFRDGEVDICMVEELRSRISLQEAGVQQENQEGSPGDPPVQEGRDVAPPPP